MSGQSGMTLKLIGSVRNNVKSQPEIINSWRDIISEIHIDEKLTEALEGLEEFSHIIVIWWMHLADVSHLEPKTHPRGNLELPLIGRFATRSPHRPNPLGMAVVKLESRKGNVLIVRGLDAIDGSPVIDIKPYLPEKDSPENPVVAEWAKRR